MASSTPVAPKAAEKPARQRNKARTAAQPPEVADMSPQTALPRSAKPAVKKRAPRATQPKPAVVTPPQGICLFQTFQEAWQRGLLDPGCTPLDQSRQPSELPELALPLTLLDHAATAQVAYWGVVSWRLTQQTGLTAQDLQQAITQHPDVDVYHANADAADEGLFHNAWLQAETTHPGMLMLLTTLLRHCGLPTEELHSIHSAPLFSNAAVLVANRAFWSRYVPFLQNIVNQTTALDSEQRALLLSQVNDSSALIGTGSSLLGAILRRLLPVFLATEGRSFKVHKLTLPEKERGLNVHQQLLREMKQVAHSSHSTWLAACWVNYRNLYLNQSRGNAWCQKHLRAITPTDIRFT